MACPDTEDAGLLDRPAGGPRGRWGSRSTAAAALSVMLASAAAVGTVTCFGRRGAAQASIAGLISEAKEEEAKSITQVVPVPQTAYVLEHSIAKDKVSFTAVRNMGALVTSFRLNGKDLILAEPSVESGMQGSTFWPSPQSLWSWPPPPTIGGGWEWNGDDGRAAQGGGSYDAQANDAKKEVVFTSQPDPKLGIRVKKRFSIDEERKAVVLRYIIERVGGSNGTNSSKTMKLAAWEKTNVPKGAFIFWRHGKSEKITRIDNVADKHERHAKKTLTPDGDVFAFDHSADDVHSNGTKIVTNTTSNFIASVLDKTLFVKVFQSVPMNQAAPGEGDVAVFARPGFASMETQGAYQEISEGKPLSYVVCWYARSLPPDAKAVKGDKALMAAVDSIVKTGCPKK